MTHRLLPTRAYAFNSARALALAITLALLIPFQTPARAQHAAADLPPIEINQGFAELAKAVKPAVVSISITIDRNASRRGAPPPELEEFFRRFFGDTIPDSHSRPRKRRTTAVGSGFIIDPSGLVVTNHHVIEKADEIEVVLEDGTHLPATLRGRDSKTDLALLEISAKRKFPYVKFGDSDAAQVGDWVIAIGNPFGFGGTTTSGIISARGRDIRSGPLDDFIQIDAPINRGNSGGPLFNTRGEVIGVNSAIYSPNGANVGIGFAIPSAIASDVITQLQEKGVVQRGHLGVRIQTVDQDIAESLGLKKATGALVNEILPDTPAESAGIETGDVIITYDGKEVVKMRDLPKLVALTKKNTRVAIVVWRDEQRKTLRATIEQRKEEEEETVAPKSQPELANPSDLLGLSVHSLTRDLRNQYHLAKDARGVIVTAVARNSPAAASGIRQGDLITRVDRRTINSSKQMKEALRAARRAKQKSVLLLVKRNQSPRFIVVQLNS